ncbi:MAG TPA: CU044_2847 family protein [Ktedonobacteraceae bacterium]|nr:CU044_2847 family protein [Ktedonobacteraceae bacterium]
MEDESSPVKSQTKIIGAEFADGTTFFVQAKVLGGESDVGIKFSSFEKVTKGIESFATTLANAWKKAEPNKAIVEFDLEFAFESGELMALFVNGSTTASMKVTLEWNK